MSQRRNDSSEALVTFLKERVESDQGISLQKLTGHLSQLPSDLRTKYGCSVKSLKVFLEQFPEVFAIRNHSNVYVRTESRHASSAVNGNLESLMTSTSDRGTDEDDVTSLTDVRGVVYRIFSDYGFISIKHPVQATVYFDVQSFENAEHTSLPSSGLQVGDCVILDAKVAPKDCEARFQAIRVTRITMSKPQSSHCFSLHSVNDGGRDDCKNTTHLVNQHGLIETVKSNYGFIKFGRNQRQRAFFHAKNVDKSLGKSIENLPDVFTAEDKVRFNAKRSKKSSGKVNWEATAVYLCRSSDRNDAADSEDEGDHEVFMSDDESHTLDLLQAKLDEYERSEAAFKESAVGERADEASRGPSRAPSDTVLPEDTVPSRERRPSTPVSVAGLLAGPPAATSTPIHMRSPGAHSRSSTGGRAPEVSFLSAGVNDEVLLRLARMVAAEIIAEEKKLRVALREVGVQTVDEGPSQSAMQDAVPVPALVSSSTQTISTGGIKSEKVFMN